MADRTTYSNSQLAEYYDRIRVPDAKRHDRIETLSEEEQLAHLALLHKHHVITVPFENLSLHYTRNATIDVDPQHLFAKIVHRKRGGYCMENNTLFHTVLLTLGFDAYMAGSRVLDRETGKYGGYEHCLNIITIGGSRYIVDVGFGPNAPIEPVKMIPDQVQSHIKPAQIRLKYEAISQGRNRLGKFWIYEHRINETAEWTPMYCFTDTEFLPEDIKVINLSPSTSPSSIFGQKIICTRFTTGEAEEGSGETGGSPALDQMERDITGEIIIDGDTFKRRINGVKAAEKTLKDETERVKTLERFFGVSLSDEDVSGIESRVSAIGQGKPVSGESQG